VDGGALASAPLAVFAMLLGFASLFEVACVEYFSPLVGEALEAGEGGEHDGEGDLGASPEPVVGSRSRNGGVKELQRGTLGVSSAERAEAPVIERSEAQGLPRGSNGFE